MRVVELTNRAYRGPRVMVGGLILKRHILSGERSRRFVQIASGLLEIFQKIIDRTSISGLFFGKKIPRLAGFGVKLRMYLEN